ncbi:hypothetical protein V1478_007230, partial [Vespula squamosa]
MSCIRPCLPSTHRLLWQSCRLLPHVILHFHRFRGTSCKPFEDLLYWKKTDEIGHKIYWLSSVTYERIERKSNDKPDPYFNEDKVTIIRKLSFHLFYKDSRDPLYAFRGYAFVCI